MNINEWIDNYDEISVLMRENCGYRMLIEVGERTVELTCSIISTIISGQNVSIIRVVDSIASQYNPAGESGTDGIANLKNEMPMNFYVDVNKLKKDKKVPPKAEKDSAKPEAGTLSPTKDKKKSNDKKEREKNLVKKEGLKSDQLNQRRPSVLTNIQNNEESLSIRTPASIRSDNTYDNNDKQSAHPTSISTTSTSLNRLMRTTFAKKIESTSNRLQQLQAMMVLLFGCTAVFAVVFNVLLSSAYSRYIENINDTYLSGSNLVDSVILLQKLEIFSRDCATMLGDTRSSNLTDITNLAQTISDRHSNLYSRASYLPIDAFELFTAPIIELTDAVDGGIRSTKLSMNEGINLLYSQATLLADDFRSSCSSRRQLSFISSIVFDSLAGEMERLALAYHQNTLLLHDYYVSTVFLMTLIPIILIYLVSITLIMAIFVRTNKEAKVLYKLFLDVPKVSCMQNTDSEPF